MQEDEEFEEEDEDVPQQSASANGSGRTSPQPIDNSQVYAAFGRDTAAGRALYKLYNKNKTSYSPAVRITTKPTDPLAEAAEKRRREAAALVKRKYQPPKLKKAEKEPEVGRVSVAIQCEAAFDCIGCLYRGLTWLSFCFLFVRVQSSVGRQEDDRHDRS